MKDKYLIDEATLRQILTELDRIKRNDDHETTDVPVYHAPQRVRE